MTASSPGQNTTGAKAPVRDILMQCRQAFFFAMGLTFVIDALSITPLLYMMSAYDRVLSSRSGVTLVSLTVIVIAFYVFWSALEWIRSRLMVRLSLRIDWDLAADVFDASFRRYVGRKNVNVQQLLGDLLSLRQFLTGQGVLSLMDAPFALVFIAIGALFHPYLAFFALGASVLMLIVTYLTTKVTTPILKEANDANTEAIRVAGNSLRHAEATLALGMLGAVRQRWYDHHRSFLTNQVNASEATGLMGGLSGFLQKALPSLQMGLGVWLAMENLITGGMVMVASMLISKSVGPIQKLLAHWKEIVTARQAYDRLNELLAQDIAAGQRMQLPAPQGRLDVTGVTAVPPGSNRAVLTDIQFSLQPGEVLAVVGPSAAGKSSLSRLLLGLWKPTVGSVRLDGVELSDWNHDEVGPLVGYVPQEIEFLEGTVAENIARLGEVDPIRVVRAAQLVEMHEVILSFPKGYDTPLGETGFVLSGGQRQRLAIARAVYGMPKYVVMDEPNSSLDEIGETALVKTVQALKANGTTLVLTTHRPRLIGAVDKMLVLKGGRQVAFGDAREILDAVRKLQVVSPDPDAPIDLPGAANLKLNVA
ncbi:type I secretion system permease/ATPase [Malikia sp.]|uniref:type I secretion system permease/ATPase n=1 Tax=Malikia sp. TaxID=2070706 RepID=UPI0026285347|nr:type I secretion system permease/ATPase [Malikia sp.]MDD2728285.1 type I secretion system permease/ATPase [Malikia sp.]